ncbi:chemotaxis response regulator protein-glutamate methylesterase [Magnetovibrio sp. PR-2]|uniref:protein-glutamate methylesterase/protein-glutamine glutaminase n=1 Tax=Magnetovibrio sp. PR-2 TaxID=3120356 RepID=UPI002FCDEFC6
MVVDDSAVIRGLITRMLEGDSELTVTASVGNGQLAVNQLTRKPGEIDVVILDIEMPVMDGLTALPLLLKADPNVKVIMASTLTKRNAEVSMKALSLGATEYVPKPSTARELSGENDFRMELLNKVKGLGIVHRQQVGKPMPKATPGATPAAKPAAGAAPAAPKAEGWKVNKSSEVQLRQAGTNKPDIIAIGSSTGGPQALFEFLKALPKTLNLPIVITQHMPATFTSILAEHITRMSGWPCAEATDGAVLEPGKILLAPGDYHMIVTQKGPQRAVKLTQDPPENFCRPAVDPMFRSIAQVYGGRVLGVILTGMGNDGSKGAQHLIDAGGTVIAQDEKTSVVWGMPGAAAAAGVCSAVLPLGELAGHATNFINRTR